MVNTLFGKVRADVGLWIMRITGLTLIGLGGHCLLQQARYQEFAETMTRICNDEVTFVTGPNGKTFTINATENE